MSLIGGCAILLAIVVAVIAVTAGLIALMKRDAGHGSGGLGNALQNIEGLFIESKEHIVEVKRAEAEESDESGEPPEK